MTVFDAHKNLAISTVATAPSPPASGPSLVVAAGTGVRYPAPPFNATVWPTAAVPTPANSEVVRCTALATDTLTITRTQEGSSARTILVGDQIMAGVTAKTITDLEGSLLKPVATSVNYTMNVWECVLVNNPNLTITLPANPAVGDQVAINSYQAVTVSATTINPNGKSIWWNSFNTSANLLIGAGVTAHLIYCADGSWRQLGATATVGMDQARAYRTAAFNIPANGVWTQIPMDSTHWDDYGRISGGYYTPRVLPCRLLVMAGLYIPSNAVIGVGVGQLVSGTWSLARIGTYIWQNTISATEVLYAGMVDCPTTVTQVGVMGYTSNTAVQALQNVGNASYNFLEVCRLS